MLSTKTQGLVKRGVPLLLLVALLLPVLLAVPVFATITESGTSGSLSWYIDDGVLTFSGSGVSADYKELVVNGWYQDTLSGVIIPNTVTGLGKYFFNQNVFTGSFTIPSSVTTLKNFLFWKCTGTSVYLDCPISSGYAFYESTFDHIYLGDAVTTIGPYSFQNTTSVVHLPSVPPTLASNALYKATNITFVVPYGTLSTYVANSSWASYASKITEAEPEIVYPTSAETPTFTKNLTGATYYYLQGVVADPLMVEATVADGGELSYEWYQDNDTTMTVLGTSSTFYPPTDKPGTFSYHCKVTNKVYNPNVDGEYLYATAYSFADTISVVASSTDPTTPEGTTPDYSGKFDDLQEGIENIPGQVTDGMQDIIDQENASAEQEGNDMVDQITGIVPNDSQGFIDALGSLVSALSYDGTECVLPIPALTLPAIDGLFPSYTVMQAQEVDFEEFFAMMPPGIMLLVQSLLTVALIVYCFKELYDTVSYFFVLKGGKA